MSMTLVEVRAVGLVLDVSAMCDSAAGIAALYCGGVLRQVVAVGFAHCVGASLGKGPIQ